MSKVQRTDEIQGAIIHEYDGIEEADNRLPRWWLATFYAAIAFGIVYWFSLHEFQAQMTTTELYAELVKAQSSGDLAGEAELVAMVDDTTAIETGRETFATTCAACHGDGGQGVIGPNLTDSHWLHGGAAVDIYTAVRNGINADAAKLEGSAGMPAWGPQLGEDRVRSVVAFLLSLRNTNAEGRGPEGEVFTLEGEAPAENPGASDAESAEDATTAAAPEPAGNAEIAQAELAPPEEPGVVGATDLTGVTGQP